MNLTKRYFNRCLAVLLCILLMMSSISVTAFAEGTDSAPADEVTIAEDGTAAVNEENGSSVNEENGSSVNEENGSSANKENSSSANEEKDSSASEENGSSADEKNGSSDSEKNGTADIVVPDDKASGEAPQEPAASDRPETVGNRNAADNSVITTWGELQAAVYSPAVMARTTKLHHSIISVLWMKNMQLS